MSSSSGDIALPDGGTVVDNVRLDPLTTVFTPAPTCTDALYTFNDWVRDRTSVFKPDTAEPGAHTRSNCYPPHFLDQHTGGYAAAYYSPGVCPSGWVPAVTQSASVSNGDITYICCPSGLLQYEDDVGCVSLVTTPTSVALNPYTTMTMTEHWLAAQWGVWVQWASSDLDQFTPASAPLLTSGSPSRPHITGHITGGQRTSATSVTPAGFAPQNAATSASTSSSTNSDSTGLSTGAKAGIGVGAAVVAIAAIVAIIFLIRRSKRKQSGVPPAFHEVHEKRADMNNTQFHEAPSEPRPFEADSSHIRAELEGSGQQSYKYR